MRASAYVEIGATRILIDCGPDFRTQALANGISDIDAVLLTHTHADHVNGLDDLRSFNMVHKHPIPVYGSAASLDDLRTRFAYCFRPPQPGGGIPELHLNEIRAGEEFGIADTRIHPLEILHGQTPILGFRIGSFAYITDISSAPAATTEALQGVDTLITGALRREPHPTHMSISEAVAFAQAVGARQTWFVHMNHDLDHDDTNAILPTGIALAFDGLSFTA
jgi:phosphoribosyl 1,2-cyclic phosphate phosphodiesterase